jgi:asparagine synthase (glutamine-hydrolysing)
MCRLAGIIDFKTPPTKEEICAMRDSQQHGGPDDSGIYLDDELPLAFGFRRLSLQDLSIAGHQPMIDDTGKIVLMFNGEIYNFKELRRELEAFGLRFKSTSDTEVILNAYIHWGLECFRRFNGMFAIVLLDKRSNKLVMARDHIGIKPLYYYIDRDRLYFASEIRALKNFRGSWPENENWRKYFLLFGHLPEPVTTLQYIRPLPKATLLEIQLPSLDARQVKYSTFYFNYPTNNKNDAIEKTRALLTDATKRHLISDAPIGLFLSGGLDSSLLTVLAKKFTGENLHTLSIVFENEKFSERHFQEIIIKATSAHHESYMVTEKDFLDNLPDILLAMDQPSSDGINSYFISKYARKYGLKAALSGIGADEIFGGYQSFNRASAIDSTAWIPKSVFKAAGLFPDDRRKKFKFLALKSVIGEYLFNRGFFAPSTVATLLGCTEREVNVLLDEFNEQVPEFTKKLYAEERASYMECNFYMHNQLLKDMDYMSMWHGLEVRVPFLDRELMEMAYQVHPMVRYDPAQAKHLLIEAFGKELPREIWDRPKQGFSFPLDQWMRKVKAKGAPANAKMMHDGLLSGNIHWSRYWSYVITQEKI